MTKVYLASWFASAGDMLKRAKQLEDNGIEVTSSWVKAIGEKDGLDTAHRDLADLLQANIVVLNVPSEEDLSTVKIPLKSWARGGRHFEAGFQYATMVFYNYLPCQVQERGDRKLILVGRKENVFHNLDGSSEVDDLNLPKIITFETWEQAKEYIIKCAKEEVTVVDTGKELEKCFKAASNILNSFFGQHS